MSSLFNIVVLTVSAATLVGVVIGYLFYAARWTKPPMEIIKIGFISGTFAAILLSSMLGIILALGDLLMHPKIVTMIPTFLGIIVVGGIFFGISNAIVRLVSLHLYKSTVSPKGRRAR